MNKQRSLRVFFLFLCLLLLSLAISASVVLARGEAEDTAPIIQRINDYLNGISHLQGSFTQINSRGERANGTFFLQRPGRIRFEYLPKDSLLVVADGRWVNVVEQGFGGSIQRYPLRQTPLGFLLREHIDIARDADVLDLRQESNRIFLRLRDSGSSQQGELTLIFEQPLLRLRQWIITDAHGRKTLISLSNLLEGIPVDRRLFVLDLPRGPQRGNR